MARRLAYAVLALAVLVGVLAGARARPAFASGASPNSASAVASVASVASVVSGTVSASASASASVATLAEVRVRDKVVVALRAPRAGSSPADRARAANAAIDALLSKPDELGEAHFEETQGTAVVYLGKTPVLTLGPEDVEASGDANLGVLAAQVSARLSDAASNERKRSAIATTVFSISLLVFSALLAFLLLGRASEVTGRLRTWLAENPQRVTGIHVGKVEFISAGTAQGALTIGLTLGFRLVQVAIGYGWLIFGLSLFEATRPYTERLTGLVVAPLSGLAARIGGSLPLVIVAGIAVLAVSALLRFVGLLFDSVARGETRVAWPPRDLAKPTSVLVRFGIVVTALVLASPIITGEGDGPLSRAGLVALLAIALGAAPLLASGAVGVSVLYARRMRRGDHVVFGGRTGRLVETTIFDVRLEDPTGCEVRVPHLLGLLHPTRIHGGARLASFDLVVDPTSSQLVVEETLLRVARELSRSGRAELVYVDEDGAHWRVTSAAQSSQGVSLGRAVLEALAAAGVGLGGRRASSGAAGARAARLTLRDGADEGAS